MDTAEASGIPQSSTGTTPGGARASGAGLVERFRERVNARISEQKNRATESLMNVANTVRRMGEPLRDQPYGAAVEYVDGTAQRLEQFAHYVQERSTEELVQELRAVARRNPAMFIGAGFVVGAICGRFLKSSNRDDASHREANRR